MPFIATRRPLLYTPPVAAGGSLGLQTNLASFFSLDNTLADSVGAVTDLTNNNSVTFVTSPTPPGAVTRSANFVTASSQSLSHADATGINIAGINASVQIWARINGNTMSLVRKNGGAFGSREYGIRWGFGTGSDNPVRIDTDDNTTRDSSNISNNTWVHIVFTWNNTSKAFVCYVNGSQYSSTTESNATAGTSTLFLGADAAGTGGFLNGNLCLFGTWRNRILSAADVTALYNSGNGLSYAAMA
jgi:hypothetical protein